MTRTRWLWCIAAAVCLSRVSADGGPAGAGWFGDGRYTIHTTGHLYPVLQQLEKLTTFEMDLPAPTAGTPNLWEKTVSLDFDKAPLERILAAICDQAGVVYDTSDKRVWFRPGDPSLLPEATVRKGDYVVRVLQTSARASRRWEFQWGLAPPGKSASDGSVGVRIEVEAQSPDARLRFAGAGWTAKALWEGETVPVEGEQGGMGGMVERTYPTESSGPWFSAVPRETYYFPGPPHRGGKLAWLEGSFAVRSTAAVREVRIPPDSRGQTINDHDLSVMVETWEQKGDTLRLVLLVRSPSLPKPDARGRINGCWLNVGVGEIREGRAWPVRQTTTATVDGIRQTCDIINFAKPETIVLTVSTYGPVTEHVPFELRDISVPRDADLPTAPSAPALAARPATVNPAHSAPWVGDERHSLQFRGNLKDAVAELRRTWHCTIFGPHRQVGPNRWRPFGDDVPVRLDLHDVPLHAALMSLCRQAGLIYQVSPGTHYIFLNTGNRYVDSRPTAVCGEYRVHVLSVSRSASATTQFQWGVPPGSSRTETAPLSVYLDLEARTRAAALRIAGIDRAFRVTLDTGEVLDIRSAGYKGSPAWSLGSGPLDWEGTPTLSMSATAEIPFEARGAAAIKRLEGKLWLYPSATCYAMRIPASGQGQSFRDRDLTVTVESWQRVGDVVQIRLRLALAGTQEIPRQASDGSSLWKHAQLLGSDGKPWDIRSGGPVDYAKPDRLEYVFDSGTADADHLDFTVVSRPPPDRALPFVIENIPLP